MRYGARSADRGRTTGPSFTARVCFHTFKHELRVCGRPISAAIMSAKSARPHMSIEDSASCLRFVQVLSFPFCVLFNLSVMGASAIVGLGDVHTAVFALVPIRVDVVHMRAVHVWWSIDNLLRRRDVRMHQGRTRSADLLCQIPTPSPLGKKVHLKMGVPWATPSLICFDFCGNTNLKSCTNRDGRGLREARRPAKAWSSDEFSHQSRAGRLAGILDVRESSSGVRVVLLYNMIERNTSMLYESPFSEIIDGSFVGQKKGAEAECHAQKRVNTKRLHRHGRHQGPRTDSEGPRVKDRCGDDRDRSPSRLARSPWSQQPPGCGLDPWASVCSARGFPA